MAPRLEHHVMLDGDSKKKGKKRKLKNSLGYIKGRDSTIVFGEKKKQLKVIITRTAVMQKRLQEPRRFQRSSPATRADAATSPVRRPRRWASPWRVAPR